GQAYIRFAVERSHAFDAVYDPTVCVPGSPTETMAPLIDELESMLSDAVVAAGLTDDDVITTWGLVHGLGTLAAAGHFPLDTAMAAGGSGIRRMLGSDVPGRP
ncbi:TetR-like C-terminal domain-containing protein, partial [Polaribacter sargassicola]|uniref:TetR-like C-terminal domain-containing protein n=1 Tax=Polaribacter sargassicola TaxID=2836891 RepID=UPI001F2A2283